MKLYDIVFSPTGGTKKVAALLAGALEGDVTSVDLTDGNQDLQTVSLTQEAVAIISVPSYGGRVPAVAVERLTRLNGHGARAILVCVYGNRAYEDTLVELEDAAKQAGFRVIAAVAAVGTLDCPAVCRRPTRCAGCKAAFRLCSTDSGQALRGRFYGACDSRQPSLQKSWRRRHGAQTHKGMYELRSMCSGMSRAGHRQDECEKSG